MKNQTKTNKIYSQTEINNAIALEWEAYNDYEIAALIVDNIIDTIEAYNIRDEESEIILSSAKAEEWTTYEAWQKIKNMVDFMIYRNQIASLAA